MSPRAQGQPARSQNSYLDLTFFAIYGHDVVV